MKVEIGQHTFSHIRIIHHSLISYKFNPPIKKKCFEKRTITEYCKYSCHMDVLHNSPLMTHNLKTILHKGNKEKNWRLARGVKIMLSNTSSNSFTNYQFVHAT